LIGFSDLVGCEKTIIIWPNYLLPATILENSDNQDKNLINTALSGDSQAKKQIAGLADPVINKQTKIFCRRFCKENRVISNCTLFPQWQHSEKTTPLCEWGNGSYAWMLEDLTKPERLSKYEGRGDARLIDYWHVISTSLPFYERWKDWRFGRRERAPTYIAALDPQAHRVFLLLRYQYEIADIAQRLKRSEEEIQTLTQAIVAELMQRNKLHLLDPPKNVSLSDLDTNDDDDQSSEADIEVWDVAPEQQEAIDLMKTAWKELDPAQQFVLQAMLVDEMDAKEVLAALIEADIRILPDVAPEDLNRQQLYHVRRRAVAQLAGLVTYE